MDSEMDKELDPTDSLSQDLRALAGPPLLVPKSVDDAVLAMAQRRMKRNRGIRFVTAAAMAAGVLLTVGAVWMLSAKPPAAPTQLAEDRNGDGRTDILDALALAQKLESRAALVPDAGLARKGVADGENVDALISKLVRIPEPLKATSDRHGAVRTIDIYVDSGDKPLAAYQVELNDPVGRTRIVGVEGGEPAAFTAAPHYDAAAIGNGHIILAAFSTSHDLPTGKVRVARLRVAFSDAEGPTWMMKVCAAGTSDGNRIPPRFYIAQGGAELNQRVPAGVGADDGSLVLAPGSATLRLAACRSAIPGRQRCVGQECPTYTTS
jgi:hypothetical protein